MTSPIGGSSEHVSRYRALGEFDNLIRAARDARKALRELREEEAKLNQQSLADDKKIAASKQERAKAEAESANSAKKAIADINKGDQAGKAGESAGTSYTRGMGRGIDKESRSGSNKQFLSAATNALQQAFANAGNESGKSFTRNLNASISKDTKSSESIIEDSINALKKAFTKAGDEAGKTFAVSVRQRFKKGSNGLFQNSGFEYSLREFVNYSNKAGEDSGSAYIAGYAKRLEKLNHILPLLGQDKLDLDVDVDDAIASMKAVEFELNKLSHETADPRVRIDSTRALTELRGIQKLFKDEVAEDMIKESERIRKELQKIDELPSGKAFKFWALTALSDMSRVFQQTERGVGVFERLRRAAAGGGGGGNFIKSFVAGFDDFSESSSNLLQRLSRVSGELYRMPGLIAVLVSSLPALISGIGALGGGALGLASALGAVAGVVAAFPGIAAAAIGAIGGLSGAFGGMAEAIKAAQKAEQEDAIAKEQARLGTDKALTAQQKYKALMETLPESVATATDFVIEFGEAFQGVSQEAGGKFFDQIIGSMTRLNTLLPVIQNYFGQSATALGKVADQGIRMITSGPWRRDFGIIAKNNADVLENMGNAGLSLANAFRNITVAAGPFTTWLTKALREGADAFSDWSAQARSDGTITSFLAETRESLQILWQILKNLGNVVNSFFQSTVDEGQNYLRTLEDITQHWVDVAKAQEDANSPLRQWMIQIRPILSGLGGLIGDLARGIANLAKDQNSVDNMVRLLDTLRTEVLPPILRILRELNESGIAVTVTQAIGDILDAIATFLNSGASTALTVFVTVLANFVELLANLASLPGVSHILGGIAASVAALAAVSIVARFTGLFKLWDFFSWMTKNRGNLAGAFADAARGVAGLPTTGGVLPARSIPSTVGVGGIGSEVINNTAKATTNVGNAAQEATRKVNIFSRAVGGISAAGGVARGALGGLVSFLGGPWGIALTGAAIGIGLLANHLADQKREAEDTKNAFIALKNAYGDLSKGNTDGITALAETDDKLKGIIKSANQFKINLTDVSGALNGQDQALTRVNTQLDAQIALLEKQKKNTPVVNYGPIGKLNSDLNQNAIAVDAALTKAREFKNQINEVGAAQTSTNAIINQATDSTRTYEQRLGGLTQAQVDNIVESGRLDSQVRILSNALDTMASATASTTDRSRALADIIKHEKGEMMNATETAENWSNQLLTLKESIATNGKTLSLHTREGLRNRDALEEAAKSVRDLYLADIEAGVPMDKAIERHKKRIKELKDEAKFGKDNKKVVDELVDSYGDVPESIGPDVKVDKDGFEATYAELKKLAVIQKALQEGKSLSEAQRIWNAESSSLYRHGDGYGAPGYATGGPVWGAGTRTSDSIRAWLSNGEFVQPTDAVEHYGLPVMEALRQKKLDKVAIQEALPDANNATFANGGHAHSNNCVACDSGGHKFADGGHVKFPFVIDTSGTKIDKDWAYQYSGALGNEGGPGGWRWQMSVLRQRFPGLQLISGFRPGARTLSGNRSYHALGRAVDLPPRRDVAAWIRANYGSRTKELITPFNDLNLHNGKPHRYTGAIWNQHNFAGGNAHDHWAFNKGGLVDLLGMLGVNNLAPQQSAPLPSTPRTLSPAASSVVNNSTDNTTSFGDIIINNPTAERGGDSIRNALYRTQLLL